MFNTAPEIVDFLDPIYYKSTIGILLKPTYKPSDLRKRKPLIKFVDDFYAQLREEDPDTLALKIIALFLDKRLINKEKNTKSQPKLERYFDKKFSVKVYPIHKKQAEQIWVSNAFNAYGITDEDTDREIRRLSNVFVTHYQLCLLEYQWANSMRGKILDSDTIFRVIKKFLLEIYNQEMKDRIKKNRYYGSFPIDIDFAVRAFAECPFKYNFTFKNTFIHPWMYLWIQATNIFRCHFEDLLVEIYKEGRNHQVLLGGNKLKWPEPKEKTKWSEKEWKNSASYKQLKEFHEKHKVKNG